MRGKSIVENDTADEMMKYKILIIDDDIQIGNLEQEVLEREGYICYAYCSDKYFPCRVCCERNRWRNTGVELGSNRYL